MVPYEDFLTNRQTGRAKLGQRRNDHLPDAQSGMGRPSGEMG